MTRCDVAYRGGAHLGVILVREGGEGDGGELAALQPVHGGGVDRHSLLGAHVWTILPKTHRERDREKHTQTNTNTNAEKQTKRHTEKERNTPKTNTNTNTHHDKTTHNKVKSRQGKTNKTRSDGNDQLNRKIKQKMRQKNHHNYRITSYVAPLKGRRQQIETAVLPNAAGGVCHNYYGSSEKSCPYAKKKKDKTAGIYIF